MEQIYQDRLEAITDSYIEKYRADPEFERIEKGRLLDKEFDKKENEKFLESLNNIIFIKNE